MSPTKIPKIIHYCSFGGSFTVDEEILASWRRYCPDYEMKCWDENSFDVNCCEYVKQAYAMGKWAFVSDVARLWALKKYGGIYLDTDVELVNSPDEFLNHELFFGLEEGDRICTAVIGAAPSNNHIESLLREYDEISFVDSEGRMDQTPNVTRFSNYFKSLGFDLTGDNDCANPAHGLEVAIYPQDYFSPMDFATGKINKTDRTHAIHHFSSTWKSDEEKLRDRLFLRQKRVLPEKLAWYLASYISVMRYRGIIRGHRDMFRLIAGKSDE